VHNLKPRLAAILIAVLIPLAAFAYTSLDGYGTTVRVAGDTPTYWNGYTWITLSTGDSIASGTTVKVNSGALVGQFKNGYVSYPLFRRIVTGALSSASVTVSGEYRFTLGQHTFTRSDGNTCTIAQYRVMKMLGNQEFGRNGIVYSMSENTVLYPGDTLILESGYVDLRGENAAGGATSFGYTWADPSTMSWGSSTGSLSFPRNGYTTDTAPTYTSGPWGS
jgi:hypothetical protein